MHLWSPLDIEHGNVPLKSVSFKSKLRGSEVNLIGYMVVKQLGFSDVIMRMLIGYHRIGFDCAVRCGWSVMEHVDVNVNMT